MRWPWGWSAHSHASSCATQFSPRAWGWSVAALSRVDRGVVLPTCVGMVQRLHLTEEEVKRSPHVRGDGPSAPPLTRARQRSPHVRGDGPWQQYRAWTEASFSPRAWGWSAASSGVSSTVPVLPTCVGMVRVSPLFHRPFRCSPHVRGDGPLRRDNPALQSTFSPRAWGWSGVSDVVGGAMTVLPTCVGMVRSRSESGPTCIRSPHVRGDDPSAVDQRQLEFPPVLPHLQANDGSTSFAPRPQVLTPDPGYREDRRLSPRRDGWVVG